MLQNLVLTRSAAARKLCLGSAAVGIGVLLLAQNLSKFSSAAGLVAVFRELFVVGDSQGAICGLLIILVAALTASYALPVRPLLAWIGTNPRSIAAAAFFVLLAGSWFIYQNVRLSMDEYSQFFQSQVFAAGHLEGRFPIPLLDWLVPSGFQGVFFNLSRSTGSVAAVYWPSFALLMAPFTCLGISWAFNPLIGAVTVLAIHRLAMRTFEDTELAGLAVLLTVASPVFFGNGISYYAMGAHLLANCIFAILLIDTTQSRAFAAGIIGSLALTLHNPIPHMVFAAPWIISLARKSDSRRIFFALIAGYVPLCLMLGFGWFFFSSQLAHEGAEVVPHNSIGESLFQVLGFASPPSTTILLARIIGLAKIWVWSVPGLLILACYGGWKSRHERNIALLAVSALLTFCFYFFIPWDQGHGWGYRYFHSAWLALPVLATAVFAHDSKTARRPTAHINGALCFTVVCALLTLLAGIGLRAYQMHGFIERHESQIPRYSGEERRVEILDLKWTFYGADLIQNDPWLRGNIIRMITHGSVADAEMMRDNFPDMHLVYHDRYGSVWSAK